MTLIVGVYVVCSSECFTNRELIAQQCFCCMETIVLAFVFKINREFMQHDAPADDKPKKPRNKRGHAIRSPALARI